jgi:uncharacterized protein (TIGR02246 family)
MSTKASSLVDQAKQWAANYGEFPNGIEGAVLSAPLRVRGAWERNDAADFANAFTENGSMLAGNQQLNGREAIREYLTAAFSGDYQGSRITDEPVDITLLTEDVGLVITHGGLLRAGETSLPSERENRTTWVVVKKDGEWRLLSFQSSPLN